MADNTKSNRRRLVIGKMPIEKHHIFTFVVVLSIVLITIATIASLVKPKENKDYTISETANPFSLNNTAYANPPGPITALKIDTVLSGGGSVIKDETAIIKIVFRTFDPVTGDIVDSGHAELSSAESKPLNKIPYMFRSALVGRANGTVVRIFAPSRFVQELKDAYGITKDLKDGVIAEVKVVEVTNQ